MYLFKEGVLLVHTYWQTGAFKNHRWLTRTNFWIHQHHKKALFRNWWKNVGKRKPCQSACGVLKLSSRIAQDVNRSCCHHLPNHCVAFLKRPDYQTTCQRAAKKAELHAYMCWWFKCSFHSTRKVMCSFIYGFNF